MRIGVVTDSTCDLPAQFYSDHQIGLLPVQIRLGEEVWTDDRDPQATLRFYKELSDKGADADSFPQTAEQIRDRFLASTVLDYDYVFCITITASRSPIFQNATYDRQVGYQLTEALQKRLQQSSPYAIVGEGTADTVLRGKVTAVNLRQISQSLGTGLTEELGCTVTVDWEWIDMRTGKSIIARNGFASSGTVVASRPQAEPLDLARYQAVQSLADDIVANLQADW